MYGIVRAPANFLLDLTDTAQMKYMEITAPTYLKDTSIKHILISLFLLCSTLLVAQTQAPSVRTGVTFQWANTQPTSNDPATLSSVRIETNIDTTVYQAFAAPSSYKMARLGPNGHSPNKITNNGTIVNNNSSNIDWDSDALAAFQDKNLNHYFQANPNGRDFCGNFADVATTDAQVQSLYYSPGIPSNAGGLLAITERNANNCFYIAVYGTPAGGGAEQFLGDTFVRENPIDQSGPLFNPPIPGVDYWNSGRVVENNGTIGIAIFILDDLAPVGSTITRVDLTASTQDHGDGKVFIIQKYAKPITETGCINEEFQGTILGNGTIPNGSTFSLVSGPTPAGQSFTLNADGTYAYMPSYGFHGEVTFEYEVCLPAPNTTSCDASTVTLTIESYLSANCSCSSGNKDGPLLQN